jgi:predicted O-methyltransferase YrrM
MTNKTVVLDDALYRYLLSVSLREPELLRRLREETAREPMARMQVPPEQAQFMALLVQLMGARRCLEIGVFTGYSSLAVALVLPPEGRIVACDRSAEWTDIARRYWMEAGVAARIDLRLAPALDTLDELIASGEDSRFDFAFIDADKSNYGAYYERCLRLVRPGGLIAMDNTLWSGRVADPTDHEPDTEALRAFNRLIATDQRVVISLVPIGDGLSLALKKYI